MIITALTTNTFNNILNKTKSYNNVSLRYVNCLRKRYYGANIMGSNHDSLAHS
jgi:hypothetical protein